MAQISISNLRLRTIIGIHDWEREHEQDVIVNITLDYDAAKATQSDKIGDAVDYKTITKNVIKEVEESKYFLLEKLTKKILDISMEDPKVTEAKVRVDKPFALRFADTVSLELQRSRHE